MKGLFVKDIELMKQQKQYFILVIVMGVILNLAGSGSVSFAIGYFTFVTAIFAITTISYDEFDNGLAFLMTLPVTRKQYVAEKYLLGAGLTAAAWGIEAITGVICKGCLLYTSGRCPGSWMFLTRDICQITHEVYGCMYRY